ncbi:hypothetical protein ALC152_22150 [Arcobacter sp. 15-2]|uniref:hypothetical protein n=1 Tax=Arcobacter sp. 15-2 TaxID=3374109 RepID=UPI00399C894E
MSNELEEANKVIESKIQFFIDYWRDFTHQDSIEKELTHSIIYNPKELIQEFIEEIERKNLSNKDNKKFFVESLGKFSNLDVDGISFIKPTLSLILEAQKNTSDYSYLLHLLKMAYLKFDNFVLGKEAIKELSKILTDESNLNIDKIKCLTNIIIFELIHKKYSFKTIIQIISHIFSNYQIIDKDDYIHTNFPHKIECSNWNRTSTEYIDSLSYKDRLLSLTNYLDKEEENLKFVFQIKGLRGDDVNITIGNVQIYNPKTVRLFLNPDEHFNEFFETEIKDNIYYCNGSVTLNVLDREYAEQEALQTLENTLDLIASRHTNYKVPIIINKFQYYVIDENGKNLGGNFSSTWELLKYQDSIELDNSKYDKEIYSKVVSKDDILEIDKKIIESMHWKRKAIESNENNEKILWHWVALENLYEKKNSSEKTPKIIFDVVSKLLAKTYILDFAWKHYHKLKEITSARAPFYHHRLELKLPIKLKNDAGFNTQEGDTIYLKNFISNLDNIKEHLKDNSLLYSQLEYLKGIFTDKKKCLDLLSVFEKIFFEKLVYIYRMRNNIVHNAHNDSSPLSTFYVDFITLVSAISINTFIHKRGSLNLESNNEIINNIIYDYDEFKLELKEKGTSILLGK